MPREEPLLEPASSRGVGQLQAGPPRPVVAYQHFGLRARQALEPRLELLALHVLAVAAHAEGSVQVVLEVPVHEEHDPPEPGPAPRQVLRVVAVHDHQKAEPRAEPPNERPRALGHLDDLGEEGEDLRLHVFRVVEVVGQLVGHDAVERRELGPRSQELGAHRVEPKHFEHFAVLCVSVQQPVDRPSPPATALRRPVLLLT
mmetsp:Transcript_27646/g.55679  ORF Transcript_27646/g.55679 Transcript_27646/m.55679 type:complete len:201 (+) Transcript_27646:1179-1781(+)